MGVIEVNLLAYWLAIASIVNLFNKNKENIIKILFIVVATALVSLTLSLPSIVMSCLWSVVTISSIVFVSSVKLENIIVSIGVSLSFLMIISFNHYSDILMSTVFFLIFSNFARRKSLNKIFVSEEKIAAIVALTLLSALYMLSNGNQNPSSQSLHVVIVIVLICYFTNMPISRRMKDERLECVLVDYVVLSIALPCKLMQILFELSAGNYVLFDQSISMLVITFILMNIVLYFFNDSSFSTLTSLRSALSANNLFIIIYAKIYGAEKYYFYLVFSVLILFVFEKYLKNIKYNKAAIFVIGLVGIPFGPVFTQKLILINSFDMFFSSAIMLAIFPVVFILRPSNV